ncbi:TPA: hypothetical protein ACXI1D_000028 [Proteus mirabilis]
MPSSFPQVRLNNRNFLLSIYPEFHTRLFPESRLNNEDEAIIQDTVYANSVNKVYITGMRGIDSLHIGDNLLIYRTTDGVGPARFRSVATSVCVVTDIKNINEFSSLQEFKNYCGQNTIFEEHQLDNFYRTKRYPFIIKFRYHFSLERRVILNDIVDITGYDIQNTYWGFVRLNNAHFRRILETGQVNEGLIID